MELVLHIGCEKTGTTSAQQWLHGNEAALAARGIVYSRSLGRPNNRRMSLYGLDPGTPDDGLRREGIVTPQDHAGLQRRIAQELTAEVRAARAAGARIFVISNEHCHSRLKTDAMVARVHGLLGPLFDAIRVHCFLRPQMDMCLSLASTVARNGATVNREWMERDLRETNPYYLYNELLARWSACFGRDRVFAVAFRRTPDTVAYFERLLGVEDLGLPRRHAANTALDWRLIALINGMNDPEAPERDYEYVIRYFLNEMPVDQRLTIDRASAAAFQERFAAANAACSRAWPSILPADLEPDWAEYPEQGTIDRLDAGREVGPFMRRILDRMRLENAMERARRLALTAERETMRGHLELGMKAAHEAIGAAREAARAQAHQQPMEQLIKRMEQRVQRLKTRAPDEPV